MKLIADRLDDSEILIESGAHTGVPEVEVLERKGWGHPDKLADDLAEALSREYARRTLSQTGAILHHNFDKLCLLGGTSEVRYGSGKLVKPIRVLVNGRTCNSFGGRDLDVPGLIRETCSSFFAERLPVVDFDSDVSVELNLSTASSPGRVFSTDSDSGNDRHRWFAPQSLDDLPERKFLHANDTSLGTGFAPISDVESFVFSVVDKLSSPYATNRPEWMGTDVKVMAMRRPGRVDVVACVPQLARYVSSRQSYVDNQAAIKQVIHQEAESSLVGYEFYLSLNARDKIEKDEIYLTATGSSIESGDEGVVGRGNRVNGLITPMRPMNVEGANGKNPVYHVGKIYNVIAQRIAAKIYSELNTAACVNLVSKTGARLTRPWKIIVQVADEQPNSKRLKGIVAEVLDTIPSLTQEFVTDGVMMS